MIPWVKKHPYLTTSAVILITGAVYNYIENRRIDRERDERIKLNRERSRQRDNDRKEKDIEKNKEKIKVDVVGQKVPDFDVDALENQKNIKLSLSSFKGKWLTLFFLST